MIDFQKNLRVVFNWQVLLVIFLRSGGVLMNDDFLAWLHKDECLEFLRQCSFQVISRAQKKSICLEAVFEDALTDGLDKLNDVVANEMWQFLKEKSKRITERASDKLAQGDMSGFMEVLIGTFLDHCTDKRRTFSIDPVYAYYREIRATLSSSKAVNTVSFSRQGTFYAYSFDEELQQLPRSNWNKPFHDWPQPTYAEHEIYNSPAILELARLFWIEALDRFSAAYLLPIKELNRFLTCKYQIGFNIDAESASLLSKPDNEGNSRTIDDVVIATGDTTDQLGLHSRQNPRLEMDIIETELEILAQDCLASLTETERTVLFQSEFGTKMIDIAIKLGMKSPSNVSPYKDKAYEKLKRTWSLWGPASREQLTDVGEAEFMIFYDKVIELCKTDNCCRVA